MAWRMIKQPDGLFARFSSIVDSFTHGGMTEDEARAYCRDELGRVEGDAKLQRAIDDENTEGLPDWPTDGLGRWRDALYTVELIHGRAERDKVEREILGEATSASAGQDERGDGT